MKQANSDSNKSSLAVTGSVQKVDPSAFACLHFQPNRLLNLSKLHLRQRRFPIALGMVLDQNLLCFFEPILSN